MPSFKKNIFGIENPKFTLHGFPIHTDRYLNYIIICNLEPDPQVNIESERLCDITSSFFIYRSDNLFRMLLILSVYVKCLLEGGAWKCTCVEQHKSEVLSCNLRRGHGWPRLSVEHLFPWSLVYLPRGCLYWYFIFFTYVHLGLPIELRLNQLLPRCLYNSHLLCPKYIYIYPLVIISARYLLSQRWFYS
jgi:hypothetical protein